MYEIQVHSSLARGIHICSLACLFDVVFGSKYFLDSMYFLDSIDKTKLLLLTYENFLVLIVIVGSRDFVEVCCCSSYDVRMDVWDVA